jgi:hypothetical protein
MRDRCPQVQLLESHSLDGGRMEVLLDLHGQGRPLELADDFQIQHVH